jgi:hypothetical protein
VDHSRDCDTPNQITASHMKIQAVMIVIMEGMRNTCRLFISSGIGRDFGA